MNGDRGSWFDFFFVHVTFFRNIVENKATKKKVWISKEKSDI